MGVDKSTPTLRRRYQRYRRQGYFITSAPCGADHDFLLKSAPPHAGGQQNTNVVNVGPDVNPGGAFVRTVISFHFRIVLFSMRKLGNVFQIVQQMENLTLSCNTVSATKAGWGMTVLANFVILTAGNMEGKGAFINA